MKSLKREAKPPVFYVFEAHVNLFFHGIKIPSLKT